MSAPHEKILVQVHEKFVDENGVAKHRVKEHVHVHITVKEQHVIVREHTLETKPASKYVAEIIGTYFLVLTIGCNVLTGSLGAAISIGAVLVVMIYAVGPVSGGHLNPAVTLAVFLRGKINPHDTALYIACQMIGGFAAGVTYYAICGTTFVLAPVGRFHWFVAAAAEVLYTMALCYVVLNVATLSTKDPNNYFGVAIGFVVTAAALAIGSISGCSLNPAVSVGSLLITAIETGSGALVYFPLYFICPFLGAVLAFGLFVVVNPDWRHL